jgi:FkbM family methyltransferase
VAAELEDLVFKVRGGARLSVPRDLALITPYVLAEQEDWFEDEIRFVRTWLQPGMTAVDVGASYGAYTLAMARAVGAAGRVWAFEPSPQVSTHLARSLELNQCAQVELRRQAASESAGRAGFRLGGDSELGGIAIDGSLQVDTVRLDEALAGKPAPDFLKLDVEGHEASALRGATRLLADASPLVMFEVSVNNQLEFSALEPLQAAGYTAYRLLPGPLALVPFHADEPGEPSQLNLFACQAARAGALEAQGWLAATEDAALAEPDFGAWLAYGAAAPFAAALQRRWPGRANAFPGPGGASYAIGLAAYAHSREMRRPLGERVAWLNYALYCVTEALDTGNTLPRRLSHARIAWELGFVTDAFQCLEEALSLLGDAARAQSEPFLAPSLRYEMLPGDGGETWLICAVLEQCERLANFSSRFDAAGTLARVERLRALPFRSAEMLRRRQLARWQAGRAPTLASLPELCRASDDNLNPEFWSGLPRE